MPELTTWLKENILAEAQDIVEKINTEITEKAYTHAYKSSTTNDPVQYTSDEFINHYIEKMTHQIKQNIIRRTQLEKSFFIYTPKHKLILNKQYPPLNNNTCNSSILDTAKQNKLACTFQDKKGPYTMILLDLETDGLDINMCNILQISLIEIVPNMENPHCPILIQNRLTTYVKPFRGYTINTNNPALRINGITQMNIDNAPLLENIIHKILAITAHHIIVGFNINNFDIPILKRAIKTLNHHSTWTHTIDLAQAYWKHYPASLKNCLKSLNLRPIDKEHDAKSDALACIELMEKLMNDKQLPKNPWEFISFITSQENTNRRDKIITQNKEAKPELYSSNKRNWKTNYTLRGITLYNISMTNNSIDEYETSDDDSEAHHPAKTVTHTTPKKRVTETENATAIKRVKYWSI